MFPRNDAGIDYRSNGMAGLAWAIQCPNLYADLAKKNAPGFQRFWQFIYQLW